MVEGERVLGSFEARMFVFVCSGWLICGILFG